MLVSNQPYLAVLARDCPNTRSRKVHEHMTIDFDKDLRTSDVSAYSIGWCRAYAKAFKEFVDESPSTNIVFIACRKAMER